MKRLLTGILTGFLAGFFWSAQAEPPEGIERKMIPMQAICLAAKENPKHFTAIIGQLQTDFSTHIAYTFDATPDGYQRIAILINPDTALGGVIMVTPEQTCIIFSGRNLQEFIRADMPQPEESKEEI